MLHIRIDYQSASSSAGFEFKHARGVRARPAEAPLVPVEATPLPVDVDGNPVARRSRRWLRAANWFAWMVVTVAINLGRVFPGLI